MREDDLSDCALLADVGGTNVRFAVLKGGILGPITHLKAADYGKFADALDAFLASRDDRSPIPAAILGVAGVVEGERCALTNNPWVVAGGELSARFGFSRVRVINDFEALAWSLPRLNVGDVSKIGGSTVRARAPMIVLGPGTGLGVAAYVPDDRGDLVIRSEGGHATLSSSSPTEDAIIAKLRLQFGHASAERALSGDGLKNLYHAIVELESLQVPERSAAEITDAAIAGRCAASRTALDIFCSLLGGLAGNLALSFGAAGGVYVAGGIVSHMRDYLPKSQFRARFEAKGRFARYLKEIPVYLILHDDPAFLGLQALAARWDQSTAARE